MPAEDAPRLRCRHRLPSPKLAGYTTWEGLSKAATRSPDLRPCPRQKGSRGTWNWIYRETCRKCPDAVGETANEKAPQKRGSSRGEGAKL